MGLIASPHAAAAVALPRHRPRSAPSPTQRKTIKRRTFLISSAAALASAPALARSALAKRGSDIPVKGTGKPRDQPAESHGGPIDLKPWRYGDTSAATDAMLMFRGNPSHTFYGVGPVPENPKVLWKHRMIDFESLYYGTPHVWAGTGWTGQAAYLDGYVFVGSQGRSLYAFEADSGKLRWRYESTRQIKSSVCLYDNKLYFGSVDDWLRCVDARTGEVLWRVNTGHDLDSSAVVVGGRLYVAGECGYARCVDPLTGEQHWKYFVGAINRGPKAGSYGSETSPAVVDGQYYTATYDGELFRLDAATGEKRWIAKTGADTDVSPVVWRDYVYTAAEEEAPKVYCFAREDGRKVWELEKKRGFWSTPALVDGVLYITGDDGRCYAIDALTDKERWATKLQWQSWSSPAVVDGKAVFGDFAGNLWCLDTKTGQELWKLPLGGHLDSTPVIMHGKIYVGTAAGTFYCVG